VSLQRQRPAVRRRGRERRHRLRIRRPRIQELEAVTPLASPMAPGFAGHESRECMRCDALLRDARGAAGRSTLSCVTDERTVLDLQCPETPGRFTTPTAPPCSTSSTDCSPTPVSEQPSTTPADVKPSARQPAASRRCPSPSTSEASTNRRPSPERRLSSVAAASTSGSKC
jgi:hypothetical protein